MLSIASGYSPEYLLKEIATGRENYYTGAVTEGEPPGRWSGAGAEQLGLTGLVDAQDMRAVYERFLDPRAEGFRVEERRPALAQTGDGGLVADGEEGLVSPQVRRSGPGVRRAARAAVKVVAGKERRAGPAQVLEGVGVVALARRAAFQVSQEAAGGSVHGWGLSLGAGRCFHPPGSVYFDRRPDDRRKEEAP